jgi:hypothetical protein
MPPPCTVCSNSTVRRLVDAELEAGVSGAGISRNLARAGMTLTADVINRHKLHYKPEETRSPGERKRDFAVYVRNRTQDAVEALPVPEDGGLDPILHKDLQAALNSGLKAQAILDKREVVKAKQSGGEIGLALLRWLEGGTMPQLTAGTVIEGTSVEVD